MTLRALLLALVICVVMAGAYPCLRAVVLRVETAEGTAEAVPEVYTVSSLGMGTGAPLVAWDNSITSENSQDSGGVIPPPNTRAWPPGSGS